MSLTSLITSGLAIVFFVAYLVRRRSRLQSEE
jgi:hypothetical protein